MWARIRFDIPWADLAFGVRQCLTSGERTSLNKSIEQFWPTQNQSMVCFSVRSGFDVLLQALQWPAETEILFSALNVKGMIKIARGHGLIPVPLDLDTEFMAPNVKDLEKAITPRTRAIVIAHLFGTRLELDELFNMAKRHGLLIIEDCAQAFGGRAYCGHSLADVVMFSFGPLKTATALGGAILTVKNEVLADKMREVQETYPVQSASAYFVRLLKFAGLKLFTSRTVFSLVFRVFQLRGEDYEDAMSDTVRGVAKLGSSKKLRQQPATALLAMLNRRLQQWNVGGLDERTRIGQSLHNILSDTVCSPGEKNKVHTYWVFPILAGNSRQLIAELRQAGFDGARLGRSEAVAAPDDRPELEPVMAKKTLSNLVILPCYPGMSVEVLKRQADVVKKNVSRPGAKSKFKERKSQISLF